MPIEFRCPGCEKLLRTADYTSGLPAKCPICGTLQTIPDYDSPLNLAEKALPARRRGSANGEKRSTPVTSAADNAAVMSLLLGITAFMTSCCLPLALPVSLIGLVLGIRAFRSQRKFLAIAGAALSLLGAIATISATFLLLFR